MHLQYKPGLANTVADSLSRTPVENNKPNAVLQVAEKLPSLKFIYVTKNSKNLIQEQQRGDKDLSDLINYFCIRHYLWMDKQQGMW